LTHPWLRYCRGLSIIKGAHV